MIHLLIQSTFQSLKRDTKCDLKAYDINWIFCFCNNAGSTLQERSVVNVISQNLSSVNYDI